jgi:hypothetical protein
MPPKKTCTTQPPPGMDVNEYLGRLQNILNQLTSPSEKESALKRLELMIESVRDIIQKQKDNA